MWSTAFRLCYYAIAIVIMLFCYYAFAFAIMIC